MYRFQILDSSKLPHCQNYKVPFLTKMTIGRVYGLAEIRSSFEGTGQESDR